MKPLPKFLILQLSKQNVQFIQGSLAIYYDEKDYITVRKFSAFGESLVL